MGVYVAVTSVEPLRIYTYDNLLLRHCSANYSYDLAAAPAESYVVAEDYIPPWGIESLRPYYIRGFSTANVLRAYMADNGAPPALPHPRGSSSPLPLPLPLPACAAASSTRNWP